MTCTRRTAHIGFLLLFATAGAWPANGQLQRATPPETMQIEEQPGYEPTQEEEQLPAAYRRQLVFFRTVEPPGTIIVHTSERFLYLVQGNNRALRYGIGVAAKVSSGRAW
jgi:lipoprotein-anchoring transpeptidase ErfK/SrfK